MLSYIPTTVSVVFNVTIVSLSTSTSCLLNDYQFKIILRYPKNFVSLARIACLEGDIIILRTSNERVQSMRGYLILQLL